MATFENVSVTVELHDMTAELFDYWWQPWGDQFFASYEEYSFKSTGRKFSKRYTIESSTEQLRINVDQYYATRTKLTATVTGDYSLVGMAALTAYLIEFLGVDLTDKIYAALGLVDASDEARKEEVLPPIRRGPRLTVQVKATVIHYAHTKLRSLQNIAAEKMETTDKTYRAYRDSGWLLSEEEFKKETGMSIADYWKKSTGD